MHIAITRLQIDPADLAGEDPLAAIAAIVADWMRDLAASHSERVGDKVPFPSPTSPVRAFTSRERLLRGELPPPPDPDAVDWRALLSLPLVRSTGNQQRPTHDLVTRVELPRAAAGVDAPLVATVVQTVEPRAGVGTTIDPEPGEFLAPAPVLLLLDRGLARCGDLPLPIGPLSADDPRLHALIADPSRTIPVVLARRLASADTPADARRLAGCLAGRAIVVDWPADSAVPTLTGAAFAPGIPPGGVRLLPPGAAIVGDGVATRRRVAPLAPALEGDHWPAIVGDALADAPLPAWRTAWRGRLHPSRAPERTPFTASFTYPFDLGYVAALAAWREEAGEKLIQALTPRDRWHPLLDAGTKTAPRDDEEADADGDDDGATSGPASHDPVAEFLAGRARPRPKARPRIASAADRAAAPPPVAPPPPTAPDDDAGATTGDPTAARPIASPIPPRRATVTPAPAPAPAAPTAPPPQSPAKTLAKIAGQRRPTVPPPPTPLAPAPKPAAKPAPRPAAKVAATSAPAASIATASVSVAPSLVTHAPADGGTWAGRLAHGLREYAAALDMLAAIEEELRAARIHLEQADFRIHLLEEDNARLRQEFAELRLWTMVHAGLAAPVARDAPPPQTLREALLRVEQEHDDDYIVFHPRAFASAEESPYGGSIEEAYRALGDIATIARGYHEGVIGKDPKSAFADKGWDYRSDISDGAAGMNPGAYRVPWPVGSGETRLLGPHIGVGGRGNAADTLRIYWFRDTTTRRYIIGHVGRHLPDSTT